MQLNSLFKKNKKASAPDDSELQQLAAVLLYEMVRSDGIIDPVEIDQMSDLLRQEFNLDQHRLTQLLEDVRFGSNGTISIKELTSEICRICGNAKRIKLLEYMWIIAFADDNIDINETDLARRVGLLLCLNESEMVQAQENAENIMGLGF